ncbi:Solute carrier family 25 member 45 [Nibea albiflora]|uniref:Solute carrier family 25 member 45 n=1 Tax=Nibea albiflora TaxID=240163 RepID=A0ACB7EL63_NIBAL|nr:Solute carrier family 25 member 45 [Nibea albiflora]
MAFPVMTTGIINSIVFGSYSNALDFLTQSQRSDRSQGKAASSAQVFTAGCFSGLMQVLVCAPIDLVKVRLQGQTTAERYRGPTHCVTVILKEEGPRGTFAILIAGGSAGIVTWAFATPMDVIKARLQMSGAGGREYNGVLHCIRVSVREEGLRVLFKGLLLNSLRAFPVNAITFLTYESLMGFFSPPPHS